MLSTSYRIRLENICERIARGEEVSLDDMVWAQKLASHNQSAAKIMRQSRRISQTPTMKEGDLDDFLNQLDLGEPDPTRHRTGFNSPEEIVEFFKRDENDRRRD
jgi:hypothetical protein